MEDQFIENIPLSMPPASLNRTNKKEIVELKPPKNYLEEFFEP